MIRGLLRTTLGSVGACIITAVALTAIIALVAGYAGQLAYALFMLASGSLAFSAIFFLVLVVGHWTSVLEDDPTKEGAHADQ
ncbi:hypothetical protein [Methylobacterium sp. SD21]|uniref:hypothetical protein n=1 Tax=Methylobacterium litchii TaxID=3138810 RepID=UPI00313B4B2E